MYFPDNDPHRELQGIGFERIAPSPDLRGLIQCYWGVRAAVARPRVENLYPDGGWGLAFTFTDPPGLGLGDGPAASLDGVTTRRREVVLAGALDVFGVRFRPGTALRSIGTEPSALRDQVVSLTDLGLHLDGLDERLAAADSTTERAVHFERWLRRLLMPPQRGLLEGARDLVQQRAGLVRIGELATELGTSERQLERVFRTRVGVTPKAFARLVRIHRVRLGLKLTRDRSLVDIALDAGYYDQAHFTRDFCRVVGMTPGRYRQRAAQRAAQTAR
ncbi:AraC family transcriptional regulator [Haliangium sp.]|uniref:AraC family transcriptional regulator n=1 Tax=Haliangium sp. TaxID=2663208 RepID=UPI003D113AB4